WCKQVEQHGGWWEVGTTINLKTEFLDLGTTRGAAPLTPGAVCVFVWLDLLDAARGATL
ncbi:hypothetical protein A2U01_0065880, partial [Trifolium medium]|nr:hypothetical protein [Trifolium medium]